MSAHKHTPGKWENPKHDRFRVLDKHGNVICECFGEGDELTSNTRLIAAAPELLDALETIVAKCDEETTFYSTEDIINKARAAIARATGETEVKP